MYNLNIILKAMNAPLISVLAYIKPGCIHRYSLHRQITSYSSFGISQLSSLMECANIADKISRGKIGVGEANIGSIISKAFKDGFKWIGRPHYILESCIPVTIITLAAYLAEQKGELSYSSLSKNIKTILNATTTVDAIELYNALKALGYSDIVSKHDITIRKINTEDITLRDLLYILSEDFNGAKCIVDFGLLIKTSKNGIEYYNKTKDLNSTIVYVFAKIVESLKPNTWIHKMIAKAEREGLMMKKNGRRMLFAIDKEAFRRGVTTEDLIPTLISSTYVMLLVASELT